MITKIAVSVGLLALIFVITVYILFAHPIKPPNIPAQYAQASPYAAKEGD